MRAYLFARPTSMYPGSDPVGYAAALGCAGLAILGANRAHRERVLPAAIERFGRSNVYVWDNPDSWTPEAWPETIARDRALCDRHGIGLIPDPEHAADWQRAGSDAQDRFARDVLIAPALSGVPVWVYTFHGHGQWRRWAQACADAGAPVKGSVSMYGSAHGVPRSNYAAVIAEWQRRWPGGCGPAAALWSDGWPPGNTIEEYPQYLSDLYRALPAPTTDVLLFGLAPDLDSPYVRTAQSWLRVGASGGETVPETAMPTEIPLASIGPWVPWIVWRRRS